MRMYHSTIAVAAENSELLPRANQLAKYLRLLSNIKPNTLIRLCLDKN